MITCPSCKGEGKVRGFWDGTDPKTGRRIGGAGEWDCPTCHGTGVVDDGHAKRLAEGKRRRRERVARGRTLREEAGRLGISAIELSRIERGAGGKDGGSG